jgi:hypothetical protein
MNRRVWQTNPRGQSNPRCLRAHPTGAASGACEPPHWGSAAPHCDRGRAPVCRVARHSGARFCPTVARFCHTVARFCHTVGHDFATLWHGFATLRHKPPRLSPFCLTLGRKSGGKGGRAEPPQRDLGSSPRSWERPKQGKVRAVLAAWPPPLPSLAMPHLIESLTTLAASLQVPASRRRARPALADACTRRSCIDIELDSSLFSSRPPGDIPRPPSSRFGPSRPRPGLDLVSPRMHHRHAPIAPASFVTDIVSNFAGECRIERFCSCRYVRAFLPAPLGTFKSMFVRRTSGLMVCCESLRRRRLQQYLRIRKMSRAKNRSPRCSSGYQTTKPPDYTAPTSGVMCSVLIGCWSRTHQ